jgi:DoxX-like family
VNYRNIGYWAATGLTALAFAFGGVMDVMLSPDVVAGLAHLGYPAYFGTILGIWKLLGTIAILVPGFGRVKEWAYAGMFFDLTGASISHAVTGDPVGNVLTPLVMLAIMIASYMLRPESRRVASATASERQGDAQRLAAA